MVGCDDPPPPLQPASRIIANIRKRVARLRFTILECPRGYKSRLALIADSLQVLTNGQSTDLRLFPIPRGRKKELGVGCCAALDVRKAREAVDEENEQ